VPYVKVDPNGTSSECPICDYKGLEEVGYRRFRCPRCGFEADRDVIGKLNVRKRGLRKLGIKFSGGALATPTAPQMTDVAPNRWGEPMNRPEGSLRPLRQEEVRNLIEIYRKYKNEENMKDASENNSYL